MLKNLFIASESRELQNKLPCNTFLTCRLLCRRCVRKFLQMQHLVVAKNDGVIILWAAETVQGYVHLIMRIAKKDSSCLLKWLLLMRYNQV